MIKHKVKRKKQSSDCTDNNYVNNETFLSEIIAYKKELNIDPSKAAVSNELAKYFIDIAENLSSKGNFYSYTFKEDMIADSIENCIRSVASFDPDKGSNPFAYFTQLIFYAFVRRIHKEKKELYIKYKSFLQSDHSDDIEINNYLQTNDNLLLDKQEFVKKYEDVMTRKKAELVLKKKAKDLENAKKKNPFYKCIDEVVTE